MKFRFSKVNTIFLVVLILCFSISSISPVSVSAKGALPTFSPNFSSKESVPTLETFILDLNKLNTNGLWAKNLFAFTIDYGEWGYVPNSENTASFASYEGFSGYFIHDYLGGEALYDVQELTEVALIRNGKISWFVITGKVQYQATNNGVKCGLAAPYYEIEGLSDLDLPLTTESLLNLHYKNPFTIQTCLCSAGINGVQILEGVWLAPPTNDLAKLK